MKYEKRTPGRRGANVAADQRGTAGPGSGPQVASRLRHGQTVQAEVVGQRPDYWGGASVILTLTYIYCDGGVDCPYDGQPYDHAPHPTNTTKVQRKRAAFDEWTNDGARDYCPTCSEARKNQS